MATKDLTKIIEEYTSDPSYYHKKIQILVNLKLEIKSYIENQYIRNLPRWRKNQMWINVLLCILFPIGFAILALDD